MISLVTGGAGFIGSNLVDELVRLDHEVIVIDNISTGQLSNLNKAKNKIKFINVDISNSKESIHKYFKDVDWVFHMAGRADIIPSINIIKHEKETSKKLIAVSPFGITKSSVVKPIMKNIFTKNKKNR